MRVEMLDVMKPTEEQVEIVSAATDSLFEQLLEVQENGCIEFTGRRLTKGYGYFEGQLTHRKVWIGKNGPIPHGLWVLHTCDNPPCCNLDHLFLGTCQDNTDDKMKKGRNPSRVGHKNGRALLTEDDVRNIHMLLLEGFTAAQVAENYIVTKDTIRAIKSGFSWKHVYKEFYNATN